MDKAAALKIVRQFKLALERSGVPVREVILFGSYATGTYNENSDIDIVVISEAFRGLNQWQRIERMTNALYAVFQPIEARPLTPEEWNSDESITAAYVKTSTLISV